MFQSLFLAYLQPEISIPYHAANKQNQIEPEPFVKRKKKTVSDVLKM